jgi:hypothetical protein
MEVSPRLNLGSNKPFPKMMQFEVRISTLVAGQLS